METRRDFIRLAALGATAASLFPAAKIGAATAMGGETAAKQNRITDRHRNLFNGDSCVYFYNPELWQPEGGPFSAKAIHRYVEVLQQNGIDTFLINANASKAWYPSRTIPTIIDGYKRGDREFFRGHAICMLGPGPMAPADVDKFLDNMVKFFNQYLDLVEAGVDWLAESSKACRERGISPWVSIRMNDMHGHRNFQGSFFNAPLLKRKEMRLAHSNYPCITVDLTNRQGLDYAHKEVRDFLFAQIREVVEDYDFEGLELDWWRQPLCLDPNAPPQAVEMMSDWFREIRAMTRRRAAATGRPYYFGMRIPGNLGTLRSIGIDIATLCREGTLDFISPSGYWCTTWDMPHDDLRRQVGERTAVYGVIEDGVNGMQTRSPKLGVTRDIRFISASREMVSANAAGKLVLGAAGIEWFNFFCSDQARISGLASDYRNLRDIDRLDLLRGREKHYAFAYKNSAQGEVPFEGAPPVPVVLEKSWRQAFRIPMCAEPADRGLKLVIQVVMKKSEPLVGLPVSFNGSWPKTENTQSDRLLFPCGSLTHHVPGHVGYDFQFPIGLVQDGWNEVIVENGGDDPVTVVAVELAVMASRPALA